MGICDRDLVGFSSIRRWVWTEFCTHGYVSGKNVIPNEFTGLGLIFLNPDPCTQNKIVSTPIFHSPVSPGTHTSQI
jgi:hypothetical protein